jgi:hypothetical protein
MINKHLADSIIRTLRVNEIDGETMEYIIDELGMREQMINQLYLYPLQYEAELRAQYPANVEGSDAWKADLEAQDWDTFGENKI